MSVEWIIELGWKSLLLAGLTIALLAAARKRSAAEKSLIGDAGLLSLLLLPVSTAFLPRMEVAAPQAFGSAVEMFGQASESAPPAALPGTASASGAMASIDWNALSIALYLIPAAALLAGLGYGLLRLRQLSGRAHVLEDVQWLSAVAAAQNRFGMKHGTALLVSEEVNSPISWGVVRPVIMVDPAAQAASNQAEAIIAHELAHVQRLDWLRLIAARAAVAIFWFNPFVWLLARRCHVLREEAADDSVLRTKVVNSDYANLLLVTVRQANARPLLAANGVAPSRSSIAQRIAHVLDASTPRNPMRLRWAGTTVVLVIAVNAGLAASQPVLESSWRTDPNAGELAAAELASLPSQHAQTLARTIRARDWSARRFSGNTTFNGPGAIPALMRALRDDDPRVRRIAIWGLSEMRPAPDPIATPALSRLLADPSPEVRAEAAGAIGDFESVKNSRSIEKLLLRDPSAAVRLRAAHALGDIQDPNSRATLEMALTDPDPAVRAKVRWALRQVDEADKLLSR